MDFAAKVRSLAVAGLACASALAASVVLPACEDPVHDQQVQALGGERPGVPPGPLHRPGQPCLVCHGADGPSSHLFVFGGTVYQVQNGSTAASGATVTIEDVNGSAFSATTNKVGNFYITPDQWTPTFPTTVTVQKGMDSQMMAPSIISRDGSCANCHQPEAGPTSAGRVYLVPELTETSDGGTGN
jgi:hypothetical protein